jgi:hypothetical protein
VAAPPELTDLLEEVRPLAHRIALGLVRQELAGVAEQLNGYAPAAEVPLGPEPSPPAATNGSAVAPAPRERVEAQPRRCSQCKHEKASGEFSPGHYVCKQCRNRQWRERRRETVAAAEEEP